MPSKNAARLSKPASSSGALRRLGALLGALLVGCSATSLQRYDSEFLAMGTLVRVAVLANDPTTAAKLSAQVERSLQRQAIDWYPWTTDASGELKQLNAALAAGSSMDVSPQLAQLLRRAQELHRRSEGYFDPAVATLTMAWGFADADSPSNAAAPPALLQQWQDSRPSLTDLQIQGTRVSSPRHDLQLDLGAIAKGHALQLALAQLQQAGCENALVDMGGQVGVAGQRMAEQLRAIAIREPRQSTPLASVQLIAGESISTSGDYERFRDQDGRRIHHLLDPHTGQPVTHTQAVTVISNDATLADAGSTALMAAGPQWQRIARQLGIREVLRIDATGAIEVTAALYARLQWHPAATKLHPIQLVDL